jgi:DNA-binding XRE family transcriptional regulator
MTQHPTGYLITDPLERLRHAQAIRAAAGWEQADMAHHLGVAQTSISKWETGVRIPNYLDGCRYAALLDDLQHALLSTG